MCSSYACGCEAIHGAWLICQGSHSLIKLTLPCPEVIKWPYILNYWWGLWTHSSSMLKCWVSWSCIGNRRHSKFMSTAVLSHWEDTILFRSSRIPSSYNLSVPSSEMVLETLVRRVKCTVFGWANHWHLISAFWPYMSLWLNHCPLHKKASFMKSENYTNPWVERYQFREQFNTMFI